MIVVSSSWRLDYSLEELIELLRVWGVTGKVVGKTPQLGHKTVRGDEIAEWMQARSVYEACVVMLDQSWQ